MTVSSLASGFVDVGKHYAGRAYGVTRVTIHHMAGVMSAEACARMHRDSGVEASANYYIGNDGTIVCGVDEANAAWTSADWDNDNRAITMEVSNSYAGGDWPISDAAWRSMIALCADICKRYGIEPTYTGGTGGSFTEHRMFAATGCPGEYIHSRMGQIVREVKTAMNGGEDMTPEQAAQLKFVFEHMCWDDSTHYSDMGNLVAEMPITYPTLDAKGKEVKHTAALGARIGYIDQRMHAIEGNQKAIIKKLDAIAKKL